MNKVIAITLSAFALQACSGGAPSTSDVAKAIEANYSGCAGLKVENMKVVNGLKIDDLNHQIDASYDLKVVPLPEKELQTAQETSDGLKALFEQRKVLEPELQQATFKKEQLGLDGGPNAADQKQELSNQIQSLNDQMKDVEAKRQALLSKYPGMGVAPWQQPSAAEFLAQEWASQSGTPASENCLKKSGIEITPSNLDPLTDALIKGEVNSYTVKFTMQKTDRGWQPVN